MIITIKGADFSLANIGTLSTYIISKSIGSGAAFDIPNFVDKNSSVNWVITLDEGYTFGTYSVTMGSEVITPTVVDNVMTISIAEVTGNVRIVVATVNENGEEDLPTTPDTPQTPTIYSTPKGYQIFEFGDFKIITNTSLIETFKGNMYGVDVSNYVGKEITISAEQAYVKGNSQYGDAYYSFFVSDALDGIKPEDLPNIASYSFTDLGTSGKAIILDKSVIVEKFDINTSDTNQKYTSKTVTVPTGAKYLYFTSCHQNTTLDGTVAFN
jgi:hypothetical protein